MGWGGRRPNSGRKKVPAEAKAKVPTATRPGMDFGRIMQLIEASKEHARNRPRTEEWNPYTIRPDRFGPVAKHVEAYDKKNGTKLTMALDNALMDSNAIAVQAWQTGGMLSNVASEGLLFLGYPYLSELTQRPEYRLFGEIRAEEMTRKWVEFRGTDDPSTQEKDKPKDRNKDDEEADERREASGGEGRSDSRQKEIEEKIKELNDFADHLKLRDWFKAAFAQDAFFGISHMYLDLEGTDIQNQRDPELSAPIGSGRDKTTDAKFRGKKNFLRGLKVIEPIWAYPTMYNASNPLSDQWYDPTMWYVMGTQIHKTRFLNFIGRPVPDILKPAYAFGGLSMTQMAQPYVDIWLRTRESVGEMIHAFSMMVLQTNMGTTTMPGGAPADSNSVFARLALANAVRDNQGVWAIDKTTEDLKNVSAPLSGLDTLQAQSQEHMFSVGRIPAVKFAGIQPQGLNATSEGELRAFYDTTKGVQEHFRPQLTTVIDLMQYSLWGARDPDITFDYVPLWEATAKEKAEIRKIEAETDQIRVDSGIVSQEEVRKKVASDPESGFDGLDPEDVPDLLGEEEQGLIPEGAGKGLEAELEEGGQKKPAGKPAEKERGGEDHAIIPFVVAHDAAPIAAGVVFRCPDGRVLLLKRSSAEKNYAGHWALPGGGGEPGESAAECAARETAEEIGRRIDPDGLQKIGNVDTPNGMVYTTFAYDVEEPFAVRLNAEHDAADWFAPDALPDPVHPGVRRVLAQDEAGFQESKHPRDKDGKFASGPGGGGGSKVEPIGEPLNAPDADGEKELKQAAPYGGMYVTTEGSAGLNHTATVKKVLQGPPQIGIHYRRMLAQLLKEGPKFAMPTEFASAIKSKLAQAWGMAAINAEKKGKHEEAVKAAAKAKELGYEGPTPKGGEPAKPASSPPAAKPGAKIEPVTVKGGGLAEMAGQKAPPLNAIPEPPKLPSKPEFPKPTPEELEKAKKTLPLKLQFVPGIAEIKSAGATKAAQALVDKFNEKWANPKSDYHQADLVQKVNDFKAIGVAVKDLAAASAAEAKIEAQKAAEAAKAKAAEMAAKAKAEAEAHAKKNAGVMKELGINAQEAEGFGALVEMLGGDTADVVGSFKKYETQLQKHGYPISPFECALIKSYSGSGFGPVNKALRQGSWTVAQHCYVKMLDKAIAGMPKHSGVVTRNTTLESAQQALYKVGNVVEERAFTSTSTGSVFSGNTQFKITAIGQRAASIKKLSSHPSEDEVLFRARTFFKVTKVETSGSKTYVHMEEMEH